MTERPLRVDILFGQHYPDARVRRCAQALAGAGYDVRVLAWDREGGSAPPVSDGRVRVEHARVATRTGRGLGQLPFLARVVWRHLAAVRSDLPDVLHAVDLPMLAAALLVRPLASRPRIVYDAFELYSIMEWHKYPDWLLRMIERAERGLPRRADLVLTPGEERRAWFGSRGIGSVVVGNWIDAPAPGVDRTAARHELRVAPEQFCVLYAGGLEPSRDIGPLLEHARRAPEDLVLVAGRGMQATLVTAAAAELPNVRFLGWVADTTPLYAAADCVYYALRTDHPYAAYAAPNNLYSAVAFGRPLVHRGQGEIGVVAAQADIGEQFDGDASLDSAIARLRDPERRASVTESLAKLRERYSARRAAEALLAAYAGLIGRR
ncbi:MAG: glycosyltransferase [Candidatus Limnocylindria bacterium]